jgi:hypothetical protein
MIKDKLFFFKELTLTTFYGDAICFEARSLKKNGDSRKKWGQAPFSGRQGLSLKCAKEEWRNLGLEEMYFRTFNRRI